VSSKDNSLGLGVGIGLREIVDPVSGSIAGGMEGSGWESVWIGRSLKDDLSSIVPYPHILVDDIVRSLGIAESLHGLGSRDKDFVYILVDENGIGMSFLQNGEPYIGSSHIAGELAHVPVSLEDLPCECGSRGCLSTVISTDAIRKRLWRYLEDTPARSVLRERGEDVTIPEIIQASVEGDKPAISILTESGEFLGRAVAVVLNLLGPELVVLGGTLAKSDYFLEAACRIARLRALQPASVGVQIERSALDDMAAARGAANMVLNAAFKYGEGNIIAIAGAAISM
jgi:predicted NBD/HSP70 family sugar kinase